MWPYVGMHVQTSELRSMDNNSDVWTILQCMVRPSFAPYIRAPMYGCQGMLPWAPTWVFFRLPMCQHMAWFFRSCKSGSSEKFLFSCHSSSSYLIKYLVQPHSKSCAKSFMLFKPRMLCISGGTKMK